MKINRKSFAEALAAAASVADKKSPTAILANVLVRADSKTSVSVIGTNMRTTITTVVDAESAESFTAKASDLAGIVAKLDCDDVTIKIKDAKAEVSGGGAKFTVSLDDVRMFSKIPGLKAESFSEVDATALATLLSVGYAAMVDDTRPHLSGVALDVERDGMLSFSTDGHRMAVMRSELDTSKLRGCIIPAPAALTISKAIGGLKTCSVFIGKESIHVTGGSTTVSAKLVDAAPVPYQQFIAGDAWVDPPSVVNRERLSSALKRIATADDKKGESGVLLRFEPGELTCVVEGMLNKAEESITADGGTAGKGCYCLRYLVEALDHIASEDVELHFHADLDPLNIRTKDNKQIAIVMPRSEL